MPRTIIGDTGGGSTTPAATGVQTYGSGFVIGDVQILPGAGVACDVYPAGKRVEIRSTVIQSGAAADRPAAPASPCIYIATDTGAHSSWDGSSWRTI